jgi:nicotinamide-nucleotide amidase
VQARVHAEVIAVGTELLMGETADTNSGWLAQRMPNVGLELRWITVVGDDLDRLADVLQRAWDRSEVIFTIGGLGPTEDDLTRDAIAKMLGEPLTTDPELVDWLEARFRRRNFTLSPHNLRQTMRIPSATAVLNDLGTAPGWWVEKDNRLLITMPGPPGEMMGMWNDKLLTRLQAKVTGTIIRTRTFKTIGLNESAVDEMVEHLYGTEGLDLGCYAKNDGIYLRAIATAPEESAALGALGRLELEVRRALGPHLWGVDEQSPEQRVGELLRERGYTLGVLESVTGGLVAGAVTEVPGSSAYFKGGTVTYTNEMKVAAGVDPKVLEHHGAISSQCAEEMAKAACRTHGAECGIGVTGVAGPAEQEGKGPGLVYIAVAHPGGLDVSEHQFPARRPLVRGRAVAMALLKLCEQLQSPGSTPTTDPTVAPTAQ